MVLKDKAYPRASLRSKANLFTYNLIRPHFTSLLERRHSLPGGQA